MAEPMVDNARQEAREALMDLKLGKLRVHIPKHILDDIIRVIYTEDCSFNTRRAFTRLQRLFDAIDMRKFSPEEKDRIWIIKNTVRIFLKYDVMSCVMFRYELDDLPDSDKERMDILDSLVFSEHAKEINDHIAKYTYQFCETLLSHGYACAYKEAMDKLTDCIDYENPNTFKEIANDLESMAKAIIQIKAKSEMADSQHIFSLQDDIFQNVVVDTVNASKRKGRRFYTGIRALNQMLGGGFYNKKVYYFIALPGGGKSKMLLDVALWMKKYNKVKPSAPGRRPTILFITMENEIDETIERVFNIVGSDSSIADYNPDEVCNMLRTKGNLSIQNEDDMDIYIRYFRHKEIDTIDLYTLVDELNDEGRDVVALILDYIKRIRPSIRGRDEKEDLKNVTDDLKDFAVTKDIPVISAHQLNREADKEVAQAKINGKNQLVDVLSNSHIGSAWEVNENADCIIMLQDEDKDDTTYVGAKLQKIRYSSLIDETVPNNYVIGRDVKKFFHPYDENSTIRLIEDVGTDKIESRFTMNDTEELLGPDPSTLKKPPETSITKAKEMIRVEEPTGELAGATDKVPPQLVEKGVREYNVTAYKKYIPVILDKEIESQDTFEDENGMKYYDVDTVNYHAHRGLDAVYKTKVLSASPAYFNTRFTPKSSYYNYEGKGRRDVGEIYRRCLGNYIPEDTMVSLQDKPTPIVIKEMHEIDKFKAQLNEERKLMREVIQEETKGVSINQVSPDGDPMYASAKSIEEAMNSEVKHALGLSEDLNLKAFDIEPIFELLNDNDSDNKTYKMMYDLTEDDKFKDQGRTANMVLSMPKYGEPLVNGTPLSLVYHDEYNIPVVLEGKPLTNYVPEEKMNKDHHPSRKEVADEIKMILFDDLKQNINLNNIDDTIAGTKIPDIIDRDIIYVPATEEDEKSKENQKDEVKENEVSEEIKEKSNDTQEEEKEVCMSS